MESFEIDREKYDSANPERLLYKAAPGLTEEVVRKISSDKNEPEWMLKKRLEGLKIFNELHMPHFGPDLSDLNLDEISFYIKPDAKENARTWDDVPEEIRQTYEKLGIPKAERESLAGVGAQYDSSVVYHNLKKELADKGVVFLDMDEAVKKHSELVKKYFMTSCVSPRLHKFAALHAAVWSGGTFIYIPKNVKVSEPLQAYFRMNAQKGGQFEHTLIIVDEGANLHYVEGCSSPVYTTNSLHAGCVEVFVKKGARARYSSIENWSKNVYNLNTKRAIVEKDAIMEWVNGNTGCLTGDTKVFTDSKGPVDIESLKKGDIILVWDEKTNKLKKSKVKARISSGKKKVYKLRIGGREIKASGNHPFLTLRRRKNKPTHKKSFFHHQWIPLESLKVGDLVGITKKIPFKGTTCNLPKVNTDKVVKSKNQYAKFKMNTSHLYNQEIKLPSKTSEDFMWLMGLLLGDGYVDLKQNKVNIATHINEDYRGDLIKLLKRLFNYTVTEKKERFIIINSRVLCKLFHKIGFAGNAGTKNVPKWVFTLPKREILSFLAGYFDADGHIQRGGAYFTSINQSILESVKLLGIMMGFGVSRIFNHGKAKRTLVAGRMANVKDSYRLLFNGPTIKELPLRCAKKRQKLLKSKSQRSYVSQKGRNFRSKVNSEVGFAKIDEIELLGIRPTYDIEVDKYHNFVSEGLIVHNSKVTMLYPCSVLIGENARTDYIGIALAAKGQNQDTGCKVYHFAKNTKSNVISKGISLGGGISTYRGLVQIRKGCVGSTTSVRCDGLMLDSGSQSSTVPSMDVWENDVKVSHEAAIGKIGEEQLFYLMSRGLSEEEATKLIVAGYIEPVVKELPLEYAVELNRLIELEIENSVA